MEIELIRLKRRVAALEGYLAELGDAFNNNARINRDVLAALEMRTDVLYRLATDSYRGVYYLTADGDIDVGRYEAEYFGCGAFAEAVAVLKAKAGPDPSPEDGAVIFGD